MRRVHRSSTLWPSTQLMVTADCVDSAASLLDPRAQLRFMAEMGTLIGPEAFTDSLVYSTPRGNTGWTAFRMGRLGHTTYHHWDVAKPALLQLDLFGIGSIDDQRAIVALDDFWKPTGARILLARRQEPSAEFEQTLVVDTLRSRRGKQAGLGPGDHLHLMVDQTSPAHRRPLKSPDFDQALTQLVDQLRMRAMTPVTHHDHIENDGLAYDAIVGITTSHISLRLRQSIERIDVSLDVFSCRKFDPDTVLKWLESLLPSPTSRRVVLYNRYPKHEISVIGS
jgi:hypothetical protein